MNVLVMGSSGFIGKNVKEYFENKKDYCLLCPSIEELNALDGDSVLSYLSTKQIDIVLNCLDSEPSDKYFENRIRMFMNFANCSRFYKKMIYFGSGAEYGRQNGVFMAPETNIGKKVPTDSYGLALYTINEIARKSENIYNLRLFGIFGTHELWQRRFISNAICKRLYGYPITIRQDRVISYTDVSDLMRVVEWVMTHTPMFHDYNVVQGSPISLSALADIVNNHDDESVPIYIAKDGIDVEYSGDGTRLLNECGIQFISFEESIKRLYQWYEERLASIDREPLLYQ